MSRDNAFIKNKLLDAFIPQLSFEKDTSPFQPKTGSKVSNAPRNSSITRQSYINQEEKLTDDSSGIPQTEGHFFATEASLISRSGLSRTNSSIVESNPKNNRKYLKVVSSPHESQRTNSPKSSVKHQKQKHSAATLNRKSAASSLWMEPTHHELKKCERHHQSLKMIQSSSVNPSNQLKHTSIVAQNDSFKIQSSKIKSLDELLSQSEINHTSQSFSKATYMRLNECSSTQPLNQRKPFSQNVQTTYIHRPNIDIQSNIVRVPIGKVQPVFRTIVRKDISHPKVNHTRSQNDLKYMISATPIHPGGIDRPKQFHCINWHAQNPMKGIRKQNYQMISDTRNLRNQLAQHILR